MAMQPWYQFDTVQICRDALAMFCARAVVAS
jgi:hypothetical protein